ncbi:agmatinase [Ruminococcus sp. Marseille-P6503]|uniref:agmatinase n=1 Tax=Ruminococcus sp. Marseille-P6503 TaxID=2364796 RepID=UPI000F545616|nr:agmatinase [Ruminococcus sp. Marseille-P6503]
MNKNVYTFIGCDCEYEDAGIVIFGAPYDSTTSFRPGTRFASSAMRSESFGIETYSPYQDRDLLDIRVFDSGDLELPFGNPAQALNAIEERAEEILNDGKLPCMIGGEHLVTLGAVRAAAKKYSNLHIVHFDAHADLRDDYLGVKESHACVLHRCWDIVGDGHIYQFGIRSGDRDEFIFAGKHTFMNKFSFGSLAEAVQKIGQEPVYFTLDLDVLDPSEFPGTGTPEAGGVSFAQLLDAVREVSRLNIVGFDVNELSPVYDQTGRSTALACKILREMLLYFYRK